MKLAHLIRQYAEAFYLEAETQASSETRDDIWRLSEHVELLEAGHPFMDADRDAAREHLFLCPKGEGHFTSYCYIYGCRGKTVR